MRGKPRPWRAAPPTDLAHGRPRIRPPRGPVPVPSARPYDAAADDWDARPRAPMYEPLAAGAWSRAAPGTAGPAACVLDLGAGDTGVAGRAAQ